MVVSFGSVHNIITKKLHYGKLSAQWVPHNLTDNQRWLHMGLSLQHLLQYRAEDNFLDTVVVSDESWCHHYQPERDDKASSSKHPSSPLSKKFKMMQSKNKVMLTFYFDMKGSLLSSCPKVNDQWYQYCNTLERLHAAVKVKLSGMSTSEVILLHDNVVGEVILVQCVGASTIQHPLFHV
ncbi:uncharacterized protein CDAR_540431 [Caerostris darwini]|uniref:Uncharacterized protein n=1 Tax=Caerostris darwini TaxID=1538125 RepID=A0AAV4WV64_9ARAC|nr:uncharacterized protein CDAR_540431 [Caerostris darwini]